MGRSTSDRLRVIESGVSTHGRLLIRAEVTDFAIADDLKQHILLTCSHGEEEISGVCGILHFLKWLVFSDEAASLRHGVCVTAMPIIHADTYEENRTHEKSRCGTAEGCELYGQGPKSLTWTGVRPGVNHPEAEALLGVINAFQPDAHLDIHGTRLAYFGMRENVDVSLQRLNRCYDPSVPEALARAVDASGGCAMREAIQGGHPETAAPETDLGSHGEAIHLYNHVPSTQPNARRMVTPVMLSFARCHAIPLVAELGWMNSVVAVCRRLCELALERAPGEPDPGFRNHLVMPCMHLVVCAWGQTPGERRRSRSELWSRHGLALQAPARIPCAGVAFGVCATNRAGLALLGIDPLTGRGPGAEAFFSRIEGDTRFHVKALREFFRDCPPEQLGVAQNFNAPKAGDEDESPIRYGLALRLYLPASDARVDDVRLNGYPLEISNTNGYRLHREQGTAVQVSIPPGHVGDLHLVTIRYSAPARPAQGFTPDDWDGKSFRVRD